MTGLSHRPRPTIVVDFGRGSIRMAEAESAEEAVRFRGITQILLPRDGDGAVHFDDEEIARRIGEEVRRRGWGGRPSACLLSGSATSTQSFRFPPMPDADLRQAIGLKLFETLHFDLDEASFDYRPIRQVGSEGREEVLTLVAVARREAIYRALAVLRKAGLRPSAVGAASESLANLAFHAGLCREGDATIHVDIGSQSTILNLFEGCSLRFSREIETAGESFTSALMRPILKVGGAVKLSHDQAEEVKAAAGYPREDENVDLPYGVKSSQILPLMEPVAQRLAAEICRSMDYLHGILGGRRVDRIVLSGPAAQMRNLDELLQESLDTPVVCFDPMARAIAHWRLAVCDETPRSLAGWSAILGYSLGNLKPINLLPREEKIAQRVQQVARTGSAGAWAAVALVVCLALAAVPIHRNYSTAASLMRQTSDHLDERLQHQALIAARLEAAQQKGEHVAGARGPVPDWSGIMKELSALVPDEAKITSLSSQRTEDSAVIRLVSRIREGRAPFEDVITRLAGSLGTSPFFENVRVIKAEVGDEGQAGRFEASLELVAPSSEPWGSKR